MSSFLKSSAAGVAIGLLASTSSAAQNGQGNIIPEEPLDVYGIVTDVYIPALSSSTIGPAKITWQQIECDSKGYHVAVGSPVTCTTLNPVIIQAATTAALQNGAGNGLVKLTIGILT